LIPALTSLLKIAALDFLEDVDEQLTLKMTNKLEADKLALLDVVSGMIPIDGLAPLVIEYIFQKTMAGARVEGTKVAESLVKSLLGGAGRLQVLRIISYVVVGNSIFAESIVKAGGVEVLCMQGLEAIGVKKEEKEDTPADRGVDEDEFSEYEEEVAVKLISVDEPEELATITLVFEILWKLIESPSGTKVSQILAQPRVFDRIVQILDDIKTNPMPKRRQVEEQLRNDAAIVVFSVVKSCIGSSDVFEETGFFDNVCRYLIVQSESPVTCVCILVFSYT
jgi:hypothetical protein